MKQALILGITGTFGSHVARALLDRGYQLRALVREGSHAKDLFPQVELITGDVSDRQAIQTAAAGIDLMVYAISPENYNWKDRALPWLDNAASVAEQKRMTLMFPGNVYVYNPDDGPDFTEQSRQNPISGKGKTRQAMEQRLHLASRNGAQVMIVRAGDFIAANSKSSWLGMLLKKTKQGYVLQKAGPENIKHTWAYLPDLALTVAQLIEQRQALPVFSEYHFNGYQLSFRDIATAIERISGKPVKQHSFPWWAVKLVMPFSILFRGVVEMRYLWQREVNLQGTQIRKVLGDAIPHTSFENALVEAKLI